MIWNISALCISMTMRNQECTEPKNVENPLATVFPSSLQGFLGCWQSQAATTYRRHCRVAAEQYHLFRCYQQRRWCRVAADAGQTAWSETAFRCRAYRWRVLCSALQDHRANGTAVVRCDTCLSSQLGCENACCDAAFSSLVCSRQPSNQQQYYILS